MAEDTGAGGGTGEGAGDAAAAAAVSNDGHWSSAIADEGVRASFTGFESQDAVLSAIGYEAPEPSDWRATLKTDAATKFAESSPDVDHIVGRALEFQKQLSTAIVPPGKDATEEATAAYRKQIGAPDAADGYQFEVPEGHEATDADKAFQSAMGKIFHDGFITVDQAKLLNTGFNEFTAATAAEQITSDKQFADQGDADLRKAWPGAEYDTNKAHADRAAAWAFGDQIEEVRHLESKDGRFIMDHPVMLRAMAAIGREMQEGGLVPPMSQDDASQVDDQIKDLHGRIEKAQGEGDSETANRLYAEEQNLLSKTRGNRPVVGAAGRTV